MPTAPTIRIPQALVVAVLVLLVGREPLANLVSPSAPIATPGLHPGGGSHPPGETFPCGGLR